MTIHIDLPESLQHFVESQAKAGNFADAGEYVRSLIYSDYRKIFEEKNGAAMSVENLIDPNYRKTFEEKIIAGWEQLERGEGKEMTAENWEKLRAEVRQNQKAAD